MSKVFYFAFYFNVLFCNVTPIVYILSCVLSTNTVIIVAIE